MRFPAGIPLVAEDVRITGPKGSVTVDLILDTGARATALSWSIVRAIGYDPAIVSERVEIVTANGTIVVPKLTVERISLGDIHSDGVEVICHDIPELVGLRGLLGLSFLKHFRTVIDYRSGYCEIS